MIDKEKGNNYEELVNPLIKQFVIQHNFAITYQNGGDKFSLKGKSGCIHQIDVYIECENNIKKDKIIIECKDYGGKISIGRIRDFFAVKHDIGDVTAWFVSRNGFTRMAKKFAKFYDITLITLNNERIEVKSNTLKPILFWHYFNLDDSDIQYPCNRDFITEHKNKSEYYTLGKFAELLYDTTKLGPRSTSKSVSPKGNWALHISEKEIPFKKFTLNYELQKISPAYLRGTVKDTYRIEANLEKR